MGREKVLCHKGAADIICRSKSSISASSQCFIPEKEIQQTIHCLSEQCPFKNNIMAKHIRSNHSFLSVILKKVSEFRINSLLSKRFIFRTRQPATRWSLWCCSTCSSLLYQQHPLRLRKTFRPELIKIHAAWQVVSAELHRITSGLQKIIYNDFNFSPKHIKHFQQNIA